MIGVRQLSTGSLEVVLQLSPIVLVGAAATAPGLAMKLIKILDGIKRIRGLPPRFAYTAHNSRPSNSARRR